MTAKRTEQLVILREALEQAARRDTERARPRLVMHIGTPKTGTTALQTCLGGADKVLCEAGWLYPAYTDPIGLTRHQYLVQDLLKGNLAETARELASALAAGVPNIMVSSEGLFAQQHRFKIDFLEFLSVIKDFFDLEIACVFRDPEEFSRSLYSQFVIANPDSPFNLMGYSGSFRDFLDEPVVRDYLNYDLTERRFTDAGIMFSRIAYDTDIIDVFGRRYFHRQLPKVVKERSNRRSSPELLELLRLHNAMVGDGARKRAIIEYTNRRVIVPRFFAQSLEFLQAAAVYSGPVEFVETGKTFRDFAADLAHRFQQDQQAHGPAGAM